MPFLRLSATSTVVSVAALAALLCSGCSPRTSNGPGAAQGSMSADEVLRKDNERLAGELEKLQDENLLVVKQRDIAREELAHSSEKLRAQEDAMRNGVKKQVGQLSGDGLDITERGVALSDVAFEKGQVTLTEKGKDVLRKLATTLKSKEYADTNITVIGHSDNVPVVRQKTTYFNNWGISAMRATSVISALQKEGIDGKRLTGAFRGEEEPISSGSSPEALAKNRRVEIMVSLK